MLTSSAEAGDAAPHLERAVEGDPVGTTRPDRIQKNAIVGMMLNEDEEGKEDTSVSAGRFYNLDKVAPVLE